MTEAIIKPEALETYEPKSRFVIDNKGVFFNKVSIDKNENIKETPLLLADPIDIIGRGTDENGAYYSVIRYTDPTTRKHQITALARADIGKTETWARLQGKGITIYSGRQKREYLADYLQTFGAKTHYHITKTTGWHKGAYILPSGEIITPKGDDAPKVIYDGDTSQAPNYHQKGTLAEWQANIAHYADGNSRICLALGTAFASPLLHLIPTLECGGFHIFSDSTDGKSTSGFVGASVWGSPETKQTWHSTPLSIINSACARNDNFLLLDEIGEADPKPIAKIAYSLGNGESKGQAHKDGGNRPITHFKILFFSTGEKPIDTYVKMGDPTLWNAGQAVRLPSIPADAGAGNGAFENLHTFSDGREMGLHLNQAVSDYYGTAGIAFIHALMKDPDHRQTITKRMTEFEDQLPPDLSSQARRVAQRFALVASALELAGQYGITGLQAGAGAQGVRKCFDDWLARNGGGKHEDKQLIEAGISFFQLHAGARFSSFEMAEEYFFNSRSTMPNHAGFKRKRADGGIAYYVVPIVFEQEIAKGFEPSKAVSVFSELNWLKKGNRTKGKTQVQKLKGDFYYFNGEMPPSYYEQEEEPK